MPVWRSLTEFTVYRKLLIGYIIYAGIIVLTLSTILFLIFTSRTSKEISIISKSMLEQTSYTSNVIYQFVHAFSGHYLNDQDVIRLLYNKEINRLDEYKVKLKLMQTLSIYPFIQDLGIYNSQTGRFIKTHDNSYQIEQELLNRINSNRMGAFIDFFPRELVIENKKLDVLTFILYPNSFNPEYERALVINIYSQFMNNTMRSMQGSKNKQILVVDPKGTVLTDTGDHTFTKNIAHLPYIQKIYSSYENSGDFIIDIDGVNHLVVYVKSNDFGWVFISLTPYNQIISNISELKNYTILISVLLFVIGIGVAIWLARYNYNPLKGLIRKIYSSNMPATPNINNYLGLNEYSILTEAFTHMVEKSNKMANMIELSSPILKKTHLRHLLKGTHYDIYAKDTKNINIEEQLIGPFFSVIILKIDEYDMFQKENSIEHQALCRFAVCNIAEEMLEKHGTNDSIIMEEDEIAIILQFSQSQLTKEVYLSLIEIQETIKQYFKFSISMSVGRTVHKRDDAYLAISYQSAQEFINYRLFYGHGALLSEMDIQKRTEHSIPYPINLEKNLIEALQLYHTSDVEDTVDRFIEYISEMSYFQARSYINHFLIAVIKHIEVSIDNISENDSRLFFKHIEKTQKLDTIEKCRMEMKEFLSYINQMLQDIRKTQNSRVVRKVQKYIDENYHNSSLSLEMMSDLVQLSPGHLGKLYKAICQMSFNDYIRKVRIEKAKELLLNTELSTIEISEMVGINSNTYFSTLFKKQYGVSPSKFRSLYSSNQLG